MMDLKITRKDVEDYFDKLEKQIMKENGVGTGKKLQYDYYIILTEHNDETGHYFVVTSPDIDGLVTDGKTIKEAKKRAAEAITALLETENEYPEPSYDPCTDWDDLKDNQVIAMADPVFLEWKPVRNEGKKNVDV